MSRRLLSLAAVVLVGALSAGCADDVAPAARIGDRTVTTEQLLSEADQWAQSPTLLAQLQVATVAGAGEGSYDTAFVGFLLTNRISFELHNAQFQELGLALSDEERANVRAGLFPDPAVSQAVFAELGGPYGERLVDDVARQFAVSQAMGEGYDAWRVEVLTSDDIKINPRYGSWDARTAQLLPPAGPRPAPGADLFTGL